MLIALREPAQGAAAPSSKTVSVQVGDVVRLEGGHIACIVSRVEGERGFKCRRLGALAGTYGTILTEKRVLTVRFRQGRIGTTVFSARHERAPDRLCG